MKLPAIQWYPGDWLRDPGVQALSYEDQGIWFAILMRMWEGEDRGKLTLNGAAMPVEALARLLGLDNQKVNQTLTTLSTYGVTSVEPDTGIIFSRRMVRDEQLRNIRVECGKKGGNPRLVNQKSNQSLTTGVKQIPTPSSSSSSSEDSIVPICGTTPIPRKRFTPPTPDEVRVYGKEIEFAIDAEAFCDYYAARGWAYGTGKPMKDWKAAVRYWRSKQHSTPVNGVRQQQSSLPDFDDMMNDPYHGGPGR